MVMLRKYRLSSVTIRNTSAWYQTQILCFWPSRPSARAHSTETPKNNTLWLGSCKLSASSWQTSCVNIHEHTQVHGTCHNDQTEVDLHENHSTTPIIYIVSPNVREHNKTSDVAGLGSRGTVRLSASLWLQKIGSQYMATIVVYFTTES